MYTIPVKGIRIEKKGDKTFLHLPPILVENPEGKESSTGKSTLLTYASTGKIIRLPGFDQLASITVNFSVSKKAEKEYLDLAL